MIYQNKYVDCHVHTLRSDSTEPLGKLAERAKKCGLEKIVVTDHHCFYPAEELERVSKEKNIIIESGVEIWTTFLGCDVHILGYDLNPDEVLVKSLRPALDEENELARRAIKEYIDLGITMPSFEEIRTRSYGSLEPISRKEYVDLKDVAAARHHLHNVDFDAALREVQRTKYTGESTRLIDVESDFEHMPVAAAINMIKNSNGKAVIAHPGFVFHTSRRPKIEDWYFLYELFRECSKEDIDGAEIVSLWHDERYGYNFLAELNASSEDHAVKKYKEEIYGIVKKFRLHTRGSDDHGCYKKQFLLERLFNY